MMEPPTQHAERNGDDTRQTESRFLQDANSLTMRIEFFAQTSKLNCGPTCLRMVVATLRGHDCGIQAAESAVGIRKDKVVTTLAIALGAGKILEPNEEADIRLVSTSPTFNVNFLAMVDEQTEERVLVSS